MSAEWGILVEWRGGVCKTLTIVYNPIKMISAPFNHLIAAQLAPILTKIFYGSLELREVPSCFKRSTIIPIPDPKESQNYRTKWLQNNKQMSTARNYAVKYYIWSGIIKRNMSFQARCGMVG